MALENYIHFMCCHYNIQAKVYDVVVISISILVTCFKLCLRGTRPISYHQLFMLHFLQESNQISSKLYNLFKATLESTMSMEDFDEVRNMWCRYCMYAMSLI